MEELPIKCTDTFFFFRGKFFVWRRTKNSLDWRGNNVTELIWRKLERSSSVSVYFKTFFSPLCVHTLMHICAWLKLSRTFWICSYPSANLRISYFLLKIYVQSLRSISAWSVSHSLNQHALIFAAAAAPFLLFPAKEKKSKMVVLFFHGKEERHLLWE